MIYIRATLLRSLWATALTLVAMLLVYLLIDFIEHVRVILAYKADQRLLLELALARLPLATFYLLPLALLLGCLFVMSEMSRDREILALAAAGQGFLRRLLPFILCGVIVALVAAFLGERVTPHTESRYWQVMDIEIKKKHRWGAKWRPHRAWYAGPSGLWRVGEGQGADLHHVTLFRRDPGGTYTQVEWMERMQVRDALWQASGRRVLDVLGREQPDVPGPLRVEEGPAHFEMIWSLAEEMTRSELEDAIAVRRAQGLEADGYEAERAMRGALPALVFVIPWFLPLVAWRPAQIGRRRGRLAVLGAGVGLGLAFFLLLSMGRAAAAAGLVPAGIALYSVPVLIFLLAPLGWRRARL